MIDLQALPELPPYGMAREEKRAFLARELGELTRFHGERCPEYGRLLAALGTQPGQTDDFESLPFLPCLLYTSPSPRD